VLVANAVRNRASDISRGAKPMEFPNSLQGASDVACQGSALPLLTLHLFAHQRPQNSREWYRWPTRLA